MELDKFVHSAVESFQQATLQADIFVYILECYFIITKKLPVLMPALKCKLAIQHHTHCEVSLFEYIHVYNEPADSLATMKKVPTDLHVEFKIGTELNPLVVVGDLKTFDFLMKLKIQYGKHLDWV